MADGDRTPGPPPKEAVDYLRRKGIRPGFSFRDVWREEHATSFTVAKMMDVDMLRDVQNSLTAAIEGGTTREQWMRDMTEYLSKRGWWGRKVVEDPLTGKKVEAQLGSSRRLETIWAVNMGQAAQAGTWERGQRSTSHPYLMYRVGPSKEHRERHLAWDGLVLPKDDPFWQTANPRNGWGCKCHSRFVSRAQFRRYQRDGIPEPVVGDSKPPGKKPIQTAAPKLEPFAYRNQRTGEVHQGVRGIDPGFEYNPGAQVAREDAVREQFQQKQQQLAEATAPAPALPEGGKTVGDALDLSATRRPLRSIARDVRAAVDGVHGDGDLPPTIVEHLTGKLARRNEGMYQEGTGGAPDRIAINATADAPYVTFAHELGHLIDGRGLPGGGFSGEQWTPAMAELMQAIEQSSLWQDIRDGIADTDKQITRLREELVQQAGKRARETKDEISQWGRTKSALQDLLAPAEGWARAYTQWLMWRSGLVPLRDEIDALIRSRYPVDALHVWSFEDFLPIEAALDRLMVEQGWARIRTTQAGQ